MHEQVQLATLPADRLPAACNRRRCRLPSTVRLGSPYCLGTAMSSHGQSGDVDKVSDGIPDEEASVETRRVEGRTPLPGSKASASATGAGRLADVLGVEAAEKFFTEREDDRRYHYERLVKKFGRPRAAYVSVAYRVPPTA